MPAAFRLFEGCPTPICLTPFKRGLVPHLTNDLIHSNAGIIGLNDLWSAQENISRDGIRKYIGVPEAIPLLLDLSAHVTNPPVLKNPTSGLSTTSDLAVLTSSGYRKFPISQLLNLAKDCQIPVITPYFSNRSILTETVTTPKRAAKEASRRQKCDSHWLKLFWESGVDLHVPIYISVTMDENGKVAVERDPIDAKYFQGDHVKGVVFRGHGLELLPALTSCTNLFSDLPEYLPRILLHPILPSQVSKHVEIGFDVFDGSYPFTKAEAFQAFTFNHLTNDDDLIDLSSDDYSFDLTDLGSPHDCSCYTCTKSFSKAYIHHLIKSREMLAHTLLALHNYHQYRQAFQSLQSS